MTNSPQLRKEKLLMSELFRQIQAVAEQAWLDRGDAEVIEWQVGIDPDTMEILPDDTEVTDDYIFIVDFRFNVTAANDMAGDPIRAKMLYDAAVVNQVSEQLYEDIADWEPDDIWDMPLVPAEDWGPTLPPIKR